MSKKKNRTFAVATAILVVYGILAVRPIPKETAVVPRWISSLESGETLALGHLPPTAPPAGVGLLPFELGARFGFADWNGRLVQNLETAGRVSLAADRWAEFGGETPGFAVFAAGGGETPVAEGDAGLPFFLGGRTFVTGYGQDSVSELAAGGNVLWTFDFPAPITVADAAGGLFAAGLLDGAVVLVDGTGAQILSFEPGGSRLRVILGLAISPDGSRVAMVSGVDEQRFLVLERFGGGAYRPVYHRFMGEGFRRPVQVAFVEGGRFAVFEMPGGLGAYDAGSRTSRAIPAEGELVALDGSGDGLLFAVFADPSGAHSLAGVRVAGRSPRVVMRVPVESEDVFLGRLGPRLVFGGGSALMAFDLASR